MTLPVWVRFPILPLEYYYLEEWIEMAGKRIGKIIRIDDTTRATTRSKFARVCVEIDLNKPLKAGYRMRGKFWCLQYEGLHDLCFTFGKFGHREAVCPRITVPPTSSSHTTADVGGSTAGAKRKDRDAQSSSKFGPWTVVQRGGRRPSKVPKGSNGNVPTMNSNSIPTVAGRVEHRGHRDKASVTEKRNQTVPSPGKGSDSRFAPLDVEEAPETSTVGITVDATNTTQATSFTVGEGSQSKHRSLSVTDLSSMKEDQVVFSVSHEGLKSGERPLRRPGSAVAREGQDSGKKKSKILHDITNSVSVRPNILQSNHNGPILSSGPDRHGNKISHSIFFDVNGPNRRVGLDIGPTTAGFAPTRPPDPVSSVLGHPPLGSDPFSPSPSSDVGGRANEQMDTDGVSLSAEGRVPSLECQ